MTRCPIAKIADVAPGELLRVERSDEEGGPICVARLADGSVYAVVDACTHEGTELSDGYLDDDTIECPAHGSRFNVMTGAVLGEPAREAVQTLSIEVDGDDIYLLEPSRVS
ncbi:Rieske (2Fe-2S) protein [Streptomyces sp. NPDC002758]